MNRLCHLFGLTTSICVFSIITAEVAHPADEVVSAADVDSVAWLTDYGEALADAEQQGKMLLAYFYDDDQSELCHRFETETLATATVCRRLQRYVCVRLSVEARITIGGKGAILLEHPSLKEMLGRPGVAIFDFANRGTPHYGCVVSTFPITKRLRYPPERMGVILDLPPGSLTQRTLIYAVRIHPERPASTEGEFYAKLAEEAESHSQYQARIRLQGHHAWETRFHRINAALPRGLTASEVCAESWPGENLVEAAIECVRCWRSSSGHWRAVRASCPAYGYDMKRSRDGVWYATGIFGRGELPGL